MARPANTTPRVREQVVSILGWPTETLSIDHGTSDTSSTSKCDHHEQKSVHSVIVFVPGNPGCIGWYIPTLVALITKLGHGFAIRGISHAGHGVAKEIANVDLSKCGTRIPWTIDGQVRHKISFLEMLLRELRPTSTNKDHMNARNVSKILPRIVFLSHSFGAHVVERLLMLRPDILRQTDLLLHLMPYTRMDAPFLKQKVLNLGGSSPETLIKIGEIALHILKCMPHRLVAKMMESTMEDQAGREITVELVRQPFFARNFFELGTEEIRDIPEEFDASALRMIGAHCPIEMIYCKDDKWAPESHMKDLVELQHRNVIPKNISTTFEPRLRHDYVCSVYMVAIIVDWCATNIAKHSTETKRHVSRL